MGARGPVPKPTALKLKLGNPGKRTLNEGEPVPPTTASGAVDAPAWLTTKARAIWDQAAPVASAMGTLTTADVLAFARYCEAFATWLELRDFLYGPDRKKGITGTTYPLKDEKGKVRHVMELPQAAEYRRYHEILIRLEANFGLTPAARSRINVGGTAGAAAGQQHSAPAEKVDGFRGILVGGGPRAPRLVS